MVIYKTLPLFSHRPPKLGEIEDSLGPFFSEFEEAKIFHRMTSGEGKSRLDLHKILMSPDLNI